MKEYKVIIDDESEIDLVSLVDKPAIGEYFIVMNDQVKINLNEDKMIVTGPVLIPNQKIYRLIDNQEFYIEFDADTIAKLALSYVSKNKDVVSNIQHDSKLALNSNKVKLFESWLKTDKEDKSNSLGYDLPIGTWFMSLKIEDSNLWQLIKDGKIKGYSIEAMLKIEEKTKLSKVSVYDLIDQIKNELAK